jgi:carboxyl-terminal processing protease
MKRLAPLFLLLFFSCYAKAQTPCSKGWELVQKLNATHIAPLAVDDTLSSRLFSEFFLTIDPEATLVTKADMDGLREFRLHLDDDSMEPACPFLQAAEKVYQFSIERYSKFADSLLARPLSFRESEYGPPLSDPQETFSATYAELKTRWIREFKIEALMRMYRQSKNGSLMTEAQATDRLRATTRKSMERMKSANVSKVLEAAFLKSLAHIYDPHTEYFSEEEMKAFEDSINPEALSFGMEFEDSRVGEIKVARLAPGGPAWNSSQVNQGDIITLVELEAGDEHDIQDLDALSLSQLLDAPEVTTTTISLRKASGEVRRVELTKSRIENTENLITGFVLKGKHTYGYISLPSFYTVAENEANNGCANDVAKEILKLTGDKIEALILDLRFNGGGSMKEAIDLAGIFIDAGPLAIMQTRDEPAFTLKDMNRGVAYAGPLIVMVSKASASASELVAAALQDYQRAIIVGSPSYGKATGQVILPVNESAPKPSFVKVTQERLFRITGKSLQQTGVQVDYHLPGIMDVLIPGEISERYSFAPTTITKKTYYKPYTPWLPAGGSDLIAASHQRVSTSQDFARMNDLGRAFRKPVPLGKAAFFKLMDEIAEWSENPDPSASQVLFTVKNTAANERVFSIDPYHQQINAGQIDDIRKSFYLREVSLILDDILNFR